MRFGKFLLLFLLLSPRCEAAAGYVKSVFASTAASTAITAISIANPTQVTSTAHGLNTNDVVVITGSNSTPTANGSWTVTRVDANNFTIPLNVTVAGTAGAVRPARTSVTISPSAGNVCLISLFNNFSKANTGTITQLAGDTATATGKELDSSGTYIVTYITGAVAGGSTTYTMQWSGATVTNMNMLVTELSGVATSSAVDVSTTRVQVTGSTVIATGFSATDLVIDAADNTKVTSVLHSFVAGDNNHWLQITAGTSWTPGYYQILSTASNAATLSSSPGATSLTGGSYTIGSVSLAQVDEIAVALWNGDASGTTTFTSVSNSFSTDANTQKIGTGVATPKSLLAWFVNTSGTVGINSTATTGSWAASSLLLTLKGAVAVGNHDTTGLLGILR